MAVDKNAAFKQSAAGKAAVKAHPGKAVAKKAISSAGTGEHRQPANAPGSDMQIAQEVAAAPAPPQWFSDQIQSSVSSYASMAASFIDLTRRDTLEVRRATPKESEEVGLFLVRPRSASAAQALSSFPVELHESSRSIQLKRLKEFRADTQAQLDDVRRWSEGIAASRARRSQGLISAGMIMKLSSDEAVSLRQEVRNVQVIQNRMLSLISPTTRTLSAAGVPPNGCWHLEAIGQRTARANGTAFSGRGVRVAILDTGIETGHVELAGHVTEAWMIDPNNSAVSADAVIKDMNHQDTDGHGTHVAGLICGQTVGVAPDAMLTSVLMMPKGYATTFDFIRCLDWVAEHPEVSLVNFSAGEDPFNDDMMPIVADVIRMGVLPFFAVGNDGENKSRSPGNYVDGLSVGSVDPGDGQRVSSFSGSGRQSYNQTSYDVPDLVAPGGQIWSSYRGATFASLNGTSMATPVACGVAACLLEQAGGLLSPTELLDALRRSCVALQGEPTGRQGRGLVKVPTRA